VTHRSLFDTVVGVGGSTQKEQPMSEFSFLTDELAHQKIADRRAAAERYRVPGRRRPRGRHALARRLHRIADRLDG